MTPLVLVHGMLGAPASFDALRAHLHGSAHAVTLPGHAFDARPVPSFDGAADRLAADIAAHFSEPVDLLGYSLGARLSLAMCTRHPDRFRRAVLVSVHPGLTNEAARAERRKEDEAHAAMIERVGLPAFVERWEARPIFASQSPAMRTQQRAGRLAHDPRGIAAAFRCLGLAEMPDLSKALSSMSSRMRLVTGALDDKFTALARATHVPHQVLPAVGHNPLIEAPALLAACVDPFLSAAERAA